ncbi:MAG TPA: hypothetical protein VFR51_05760 [Pyrinomonadaceae bacterium]|nr:hypothetical protein [Pyrinomonadaceae bacterium]
MNNRLDDSTSGPIYVRGMRSRRFRFVQYDIAAEDECTSAGREYECCTDP